MTNLLVKLFVKDSENVTNQKVREKYGVLSSFVGIFCNICLFVIKFILGIVSNSIAITSDAFNNLSDCVSCIITFFGYRLASKPADKNHPFGHGRMEYIISIFISFLIFLVGVELLGNSWDKILHPQEINFSIVVLVIMICTVLVKVWMYLFNTKLGKKIDNMAMIATAKDSLNDVIATSVAILSLILSQYFSTLLDGIMGLFVSCFILYSGYGIVKDTIDELLGKPADKEVVDELRKLIMSHDKIVGIHDLIIHNYGPGNSIGSCHVEVDSHEDFVEIHDLVDKIEKEVQDNLHIMMTLHMDPVDTRDEVTSYYRNKVIELIKAIDDKLSIHDFRIVSGPSHINLIFDCVVPYGLKCDELKIKEEVDKGLKSEDIAIFTVITFDREFV